MTTNGHVPLTSLYLLERTGPTLPKIDDLSGTISQTLARLRIAGDKLRGKRIAVGVGSRGVAKLQEIVRTVCGWLKEQGAQPFIFPAMGSHGGGTAEGQEKILEEYGVTKAGVGVEIRSSMETVALGATPEGIRVFADRNAWESDAIVVVNRIKPHTDFSGKIESGMLKMLTIGLGKLDGATDAHRNARKHGYENTIRAVAARVLASGKILCGVGVVENEMHEIAAVRAGLPESLVALDESTLELARTMVPRIPFEKLHLLIVDEMGKNISGAGMDTKVIGRGVKLPPGEAPKISVIYVRDLTAESDGNAIGIGYADLIHERLYRKIDFEKTYLNSCTALSLAGGRSPIHLASDRENLDLALNSLGGPGPEAQELAWISNTLNLNRIAISSALAREASTLKQWRLSEAAQAAEFDAAGNLKAIM